MALFKKHGKWYIDYYYQGERIRQSIGPSKRAAVQALAARKGEILQGRFNLHQVKPTPRFEAFAEEYLEWARIHHRSYRRFTVLRMGVLLPFFRGKRLQDLTPWVIEKYKAQRRHEVKPATVNRELAVLSSMLSKAIEWDHLREHPMKGGRVKRFQEENHPERILSDEEEPRLLSAASARLRPVIILALDTGARLGELLSLTPAHVDLRQREIHLLQTKSGKARRVPLTDRACAVLEELVREAKDGEPLCGAARGERPWWLINAFERACSSAGIRGLRFHDLRHTFATRLVTNSVDLATVQKLLGHADIRMTLRYAHPTSRDMARAVEILNARAEHGHNMDTSTKIVRVGEWPTR